MPVPYCVKETEKFVCKGDVVQRIGKGKYPAFGKRLLVLENLPGMLMNPFPILYREYHTLSLALPHDVVL